MPGDDVTLGRGSHRAGVEVEAGAGLLSLLHLGDLRGELGDELVVDRGLDEDALHRNTHLTGVEHPAPGDAVGGTVDVGVGQHDGRVLAAQLQAARDEPLSARHRDFAAGARRPGEVDVVGVLDHRDSGGAVPGGQFEHGRCASLFPATGQFDRRQRCHLRGFEQHRRAGREGGHQVQRQHGKRKVPWLDHPDERVGPVDGGELLDLEQRAVRARVAIGEELLGIAGPVFDGVGDQHRLDAGIAAGLAGLVHQHLGEEVGVVEDPVLPEHQPLLAAAGADGLPLGLGGAQLAGLGGDGLGAVDRHGAGDPAVRRVVHRDGVDLRLHSSHVGFLSHAN